MRDHTFQQFVICAGRGGGVLKYKTELEHLPFPAKGARSKPFLILQTGANSFLFLYVQFRIYSKKEASGSSKQIILKIFCPQF